MSNKIKSLQTIHLALCAGLLVAYVFAGPLGADTFRIPTLDASGVGFLAVPFLAVVASNVLFRFRVKSIDHQLALEEKMGDYQTASLIRWAILEMAAFVILFVKPELLVVGVMLIAYLAFLRPTEDRIKTDLQHLD